MLAHALFEALAYLVAFALLRRSRRAGDSLESEPRWTLIVVAVLGAALGSKLLHHLAHPSELAVRLADPVQLMGGKTIVGGLLGGWIAVELAKRRMGIRRRTGDLYVLPLIVGMAIGRVGCFAAGLGDDTYGLPTASPLGVDFGDGSARHPVQLYEIGFLLALGGLLLRWARPGALPEGARFRIFLGAYLAFRLLVDELKPYEQLAGLGAIQWACVLGLVALAPDAWRALRASRGRRSHASY